MAMTYRVDTYQYPSAFGRAVRWTRKHHGIPNDCVVEDVFEKEFDVKLEGSKEWGGVRYAHFKTEQDFLMFLMRWS